MGLLVGLVVAFASILVAFMSLNASATADLQFVGAFPVYCGLFLLALQAWLWGVVVWVCEAHHINYVFVLNADTRTALRHQHALMIGGALAFLVTFFTVLFVVLLVYTNATAGIVSIVLFFSLLLIIALPFDVLFWPTRAYMWRTLRSIVMTPFVRVEFQHFFVGDILTSLLCSLQDAAYAFCFFGSSDFYSEQPSLCASSEVLRHVGYALAFLPFWFRFAQSLRRYRDDPVRARLQWVNAVKCLSAMVVIALNLIASHQTGAARRVMIWVWAVAALCSSLLAFVWDLRMDWGLVDLDSPNYPLRAISLFPAWAYYAAAALNFVLRLSWVITISPAAFGFNFPQRYFLLGIAALEIVRRSVWAVLRLEHEHVANAESYRVVTAVPLLFGGDDGGDADGTSNAVSKTRHRAAREAAMASVLASGPLGALREAALRAGDDNRVVSDVEAAEAGAGAGRESSQIAGGATASASSNDAPRDIERQRQLAARRAEFNQRAKAEMDRAEAIKYDRRFGGRADDEESQDSDDE